MSRATQRQSLQELIASGGRARSHKAVLRVLGEKGPLTDLQISEISPVSRSGVCGRVSELMAIGYVEECAAVRCASSRKLVRRTRLTPAGQFALRDLIAAEKRAGVFVA